MLKIKTILVIFLLFVFSNSVFANLLIAKNEMSADLLDITETNLQEEYENDKTFFEKIGDGFSKIGQKLPKRKTTKVKQKKTEKYIKAKRLKTYSYRKVRKQNKMPITFEQYLEISKDIKRVDRKVVPAEFKPDEKYVNMPIPELRIVKYNNPPGSRELDLRMLMTRRQLNTVAVLSPDYKRLAYAVIYSYPTAEQVAAEMFYYDVPSGTAPVDVFKTFHTMNVNRTPFLQTGTDRFFQYEKRTFTIIDWSEDGQRIAVKEKIGSQTQGPWKTIIHIYDFNEKKAYVLDALSEAIRYYWRENHELELQDYMWDIYPIGWDLHNKDRLIVFAYAYGKNHQGSQFLGAWSMDYKNQRPELMSETNINFEVSINGTVLEFVKK